MKKLRPLQEYKTLVFDCDGVVLNSNKVKTQAFYEAVLPYGEQAAQAMVDYHVSNGGVSRYKKFALFLDELAPTYAKDVQGPDLDTLLKSYAEKVRKGLLSCDVAEGLKSLREETVAARWLIVSGGDQSELQDVFALRGLNELFDGGIFGSPDTKDEILMRELETEKIQQPALFLGDSKYDYQAAIQAGLDFIFLSGWSEVSSWQEWVKEKNIVFSKNIAGLC